MKKLRQTYLGTITEVLDNGNKVKVMIDNLISEPIEAIVMRPLSFGTNADYNVNYKIQKKSQCIVGFLNDDINSCYVKGQINADNSINDSVFSLVIPEITIDVQENKIELNISGTKVTLEGSGINITGDIKVNGEVTANGIKLSNHTHPFIGQVPGLPGKTMPPV